MKITLVRGDDWEGIYVNGKLEMENHTLDVARTLRRLSYFDIPDQKIDFAEIDADEEWLEKLGSLPNSLEDVKGAAL